MSNGWTGGQYGLFRAVFALGLLLHFLRAPIWGGEWSAPASAVRLVGAALSICLALGLADRAAALILLATGALLSVSGSFPASPGDLLIAGLLVAHASIPGTPYGSWAARGRTDPGGGWRLPGPIFAAAWIALAASYASSSAVKLADASWLSGGAELLFAPLALVARAQRWIWLAGLCSQLARPLLGAEGPSLGLGMLHLFTFDPAWIRASGAGEPARLFYDGGCGLCHAAVRFVIAEDPQGRAFRFAPLASETFESQVSPQQRAALPDSLVLVLPDGRVLVRSRAVREIGARLGGLWRLLALASRGVPTRWLDVLYDAVARHRARLFAAPTDTCPLIPPELRARFE